MTNSQLVVITSIAHVLQRIERDGEVGAQWLQLIAQYSVMRVYRELPLAASASIAFLTALFMVRGVGFFLFVR
jgi:hypothetical protein